LSMQLLPIMAFGITSLEWYAFGYSLVFSSSDSAFIGDFHNAGLHGVLEGTSQSFAGTPDLLFFLHHNMVASAR
jgi:ammonia channel protein AmtB